MAIYNKDVVDKLLNDIQLQIPVNQVINTKSQLPIASSLYNNQIYKSTDTNTWYRCVTEDNGTTYKWVDVLINYDTTIATLTEKITAITGTMTYMGNISTKDALPGGSSSILPAYTEKDKGKTYFVVDTGIITIWDGSAWSEITKIYTAGEGIKIVNNVISATGDNLKSGNGININNNTISVNLSTDKKIGSNALGYNDLGQLKININTTNGLTDNNNALELQVNTEQFDQTQSVLTLNGSIETWTFTLDDGTTTTKKIFVFN